MSIRDFCLECYFKPQRPFIKIETKMTKLFTPWAIYPHRPPTSSKPDLICIKISPFSRPKQINLHCRTPSKAGPVLPEPVWPAFHFDKLAFSINFPGKPNSSVEALTCSERGKRGKLPSSGEPRRGGLLVPD